MPSRKWAGNVTTQKWKKGQTKKKRKSAWWLIKETLPLGFSGFAAGRKMAGEPSRCGVTIMCSWVPWGTERSKISSSPFYLCCRWFWSSNLWRQHPHSSRATGLSKFSVSRHGRTWRSCRFLVSGRSGSVLFFLSSWGPVPDIHGKPRQSEPAHFSVQERPKVAFHQQIPGFVHFCLDSYRHFSSVKLQWDQGD